MSTIQVEEEFLKFPEGEFTPFIGEKLREANPSTQNKPNRNSNYKGKNSFPSKRNKDDRYKDEKQKTDKPKDDKFKNDKYKKGKPNHVKKEAINPLEEAKLYLQKADSVLGSEKLKAPTTHPSKKETHAHHKEKVPRVKHNKPYEPKTK